MMLEENLAQGNTWQACVQELSAAGGEINPWFERHNTYSLWCII